MSRPRRSFGATALRAGIPFGLAMGTFNGVQSGALPGLVSGVVMGVAFGLVLAGFVRWQSGKFDKIRPEFEAEGLELDGPANLGATGGWLFLSKRRLVFVPHKINLSTKRTEIPRGDIVESKATRAARGLEVVTKDGSHKFAVDPRDNFKQALDQRD